MARKPLNLPLSFSRLQHIPFRVISRAILGTATSGILIFISWMIYRVYFQLPQSDPVVLDQRTELLQINRVEELEAYEKNLDVPPFPASIFPTSDISIIP